jgi:hypothetical protein
VENEQNKIAKFPANLPQPLQKSQPSLKQQRQHFNRRLYAKMRIIEHILHLAYQDARGSPQPLAARKRSSD